MAYFKFTKAILEGKPIDVYNHGNLNRDFTYIDDIIDGVVRIIKKANPDKYELFNIGNSKTVELMEFINTLESILKKKAIKRYKEMQAGDVKETFADISKINKKYGYSPFTRIDYGLEEFINWYKEYYGNKNI